MKKRVAIWMHGGIGNGNFSQGYPMLQKLVDRLTSEFDIVVYSHTPPNAGFETNQFPLRYPPRSINSGKIRWLFLMYYFLKDHFRKKFNVTIAFWGYPTGFFVALIKVLFGVPCVISVLGADSASIPSLDYGIFHKRFPKGISTWAYLKADSLLSISEFQKKRLMSFGINRYIQVIPWGADTTLYTYSNKTIGNVLQVIHVGHINPVKDQATLLRAFALIVKTKPAHLKIFGLDCMDGAMNRFCAELGIEDKVEFKGVIRYDELPQYYQTANLMLHTSLSEAQCMALTEAAATGVLMAGTRVGVLYDIGEECGITVEVGDYEGLAKKVLDLLEKPEEWEAKVQNAKAWSENHDLDWTVEELSAVLNKY